MKRCVIVGGAGINNYDYIRSRLYVDDYIVFCDSGLRHLEPLEVKPSLIVGDFDSHDNPHDDFLLIGVAGARLDHTLGNVSILLYLDSIRNKYPPA